MNGHGLVHAPRPQQLHQRPESVRLGHESLPGGVTPDARDEALVTARTAAALGQEGL